MVVILISTNFIFVIFGSGNLQPWNEPQKEESEKISKPKDQENVEKS